MDAKTIEAHRKHLSGEYQNIVTSINRGRVAADEIRVENTEDEGDLATISHDKHLLYNLQESGFQRARFIKIALKAIEDGQYGECSKCGEDIKEKRLQAVPWATMCIDCQERSEQENTPARQISMGLEPEMES